MSILDQPYFHDEAAAYAKLEKIVWPDGPACPHCGKKENTYEIRGRTARPGLRTCSKCRKQFTVKVGTILEKSHVPLHKWLQAAFLMVSSKKGIRCLVGDELLQDILAAFRKRVEVQGLIRYRRDGTPINIKVDRLVVFPEGEDLPGFGDIKGLLRDGA